MTDESRPIGEATDALAGAGDELAQLVMAGKRYQVHKTRCAACGRAVLIASRGRHSALYDRVALDPLHGVVGTRHACPRSSAASNAATRRGA